MKVQAPTALDPGALVHYWYPGRDGVETITQHHKDFAQRLADTSRELMLVRPPAGAPMPSHPWLMWMRKPAVKHPLCPGWLLLFVWQDVNKVPLPLDDRIFANLYRISAGAFGGAEKYFDSVCKTIIADKARAAKQDKDNTDAKRKEVFASRKISTAGRGNKFALHHDGTILPSRSEMNWVRENEMRRMPGEQAKALRERLAKRTRKSQAD